MAYKVGMLDTDSAYQRAFMEYLNLRATIPIRLFTFTSEEALEQFCDQNTLDLLLVGDEMSNLKWKKQTVVLTKSREFEKKEHYIFRYQSMEMIVKYILDQMDQQHPNVENEYAFLAVYSPLGRCGKTEYAKKICGKFRRSLYVNWEGISSEKAEEGIGSWMIYCMKSRNEECIEYLQQHSCKKVPPPDSYQDITQVEKGIWSGSGIRSEKNNCMMQLRLISEPPCFVDIWCWMCLTKCMCRNLGIRFRKIRCRNFAGCSN